MGRKPVGRRAMTPAQRMRRLRAKAQAAKLERTAVRMNALAEKLIAAVLAGGDLAAVAPDTQQRCLMDAQAILVNLRTAGLSIVRTKTVK
jgi:hypothetical protein